MPERPVVHFSSIVYLARAGRLELLKTAGDRVVVPEAAAAEIRRRPSDAAERIALQSTRWIETVPAPAAPDAVGRAHLGESESAVLAWAAAHPGTEVIVDDLKTRHCAAALDLPVRSTLGLVLAARKHGMIKEARLVFTELRAAGMYLPDAVIQAALQLVGE